MDALVGLLDGPRARGAFVLRVAMAPPWSVRVQDEAPLSIVAMARGEAWVTFDDGETARIGPGDVAVLRGPDPYEFGGEPGTTPLAVIHPGQVCTTPDGRHLEEPMHLGVRTWGNDPDGSAQMLVGSYHLPGEVSQRLLRALPRLVVVRADEWRSPLIGLLEDEIMRDDAGQETVLDRLLDLLLISVLRTWLSRPDADAPAWFRAQADPVVGHALALLQHHPAEPWTVASLARETGVSRAALARRFTDLVGEPPMAFLTEWRLTVAADLLCEPGETIASVAAQVGYGSAFALSTAFKRVRGITPKEHRQRVLAATDEEQLVVARQLS